MKKHKIPDTKEPCRECEYGNCYNDSFCECHHPLIAGSRVQISCGCVAKMEIEPGGKEITDWLPDKLKGSKQ